MAFIFSTSHLPETRTHRPDHLEEEEDDEPSAANRSAAQIAEGKQTAAGSPKGERSESTRMQQPPPRAGMVRAFSHLPAPRPLADTSGPLSTRPATPVGRPRPYVDPEAVADHAPRLDSDHDDKARAHEYEDDSPWHMPRITAQDLPPQDHDEDVDAPGSRSAPIAAARPWENPRHDTGFDATPPEGRSAPRDQGAGSPHEPWDIHARSEPLQSLADKAAYHDDLVHRTGGGPEDAQDQRGGFFQNAAATHSPRQTQTGRPEDSRSNLAAPAQPVAAPLPKGRSPAPSTTGSMPGPHGAASPAPGATQSPSSPPAKAAPSSPQPTTPGATKEVPVPLKINPGDEASVDARGRKFGDTVRSVMRAELAGSPMAAALLKRAVELSGKQVIIQMIPHDPKRKDQKEQEAWSEIGPDGTIIIHISPTNLKSGTLSHEVSHAIQGWHLEAAKKDKMAKAGTDALSEGEINNAIRAGRAELNKVVKVRAEEDDLSHPADYKENEAVRAANIVTAELTAAEIKAELEAHPVSDPKIIADMFWKKQTALREASGHETNTPRPLPIGTKYGHYDFARVLELLGNNVTLDHLIQWRFDHLGGN